MKSAKKIRVLLVDDHVAVLMGLRACLKHEPDMLVVAEAMDGQQAIEQYRAHRPDITLMDSRMPRLSGVDATRAICEEFPGARIIVLTTRQGDEDIFRALAAGARSFITKNMPTEEMLTAIRSLHEDCDYLPAEIHTALQQREGLAALSAREQEVLELLARGGSNKEIASALGVAEITVKKHIGHLLEKLDVLDRNQAVIAALRRGIIHLDETH
jgi:two-component system, NarL family, response regulator